MADLPTGTVSFLFTDVEGSTRLWEADRDAMAASLSVHDTILRGATADHGGHVFSTAGDAFAIAFPTADSAVAAALEAQLALTTTDWPGPAIAVRMGIHTGTAEERDGDYFGPTLNRAARIMSAGHGGQILLSSVTAALAGGHDLGDLGTHHLKDLAEPEHIREVRHPDLPVVDRPIRTVDVRRHNLPEPLTSFVGRVRELDGVTAAIADHRLTVLTGSGGTGKTRLAIEAARHIADHQPDGAWLVELAPVTDPELVVATIADTWGLRGGEGATIDEVLIRYLGARTLVLVIDNCEHVLDGAAAAIRAVLDGAPGVHVIATSRETLGIAGEQAIRVPSLALPDDDGRSEAVDLFVDRARSVDTGFDPADDPEAIARICRRVDGIPLGLELAAARLRSLSVGDLADRLDESFRILSGSAKATLPRHRTLHATIDWSHDLLEPEERAVFRRCAPFAGGFDLPAAERVCAGPDVDDWDVLDRLDSLVDKSLIGVDRSGPGPRFRLLEPVRQYAAERLDEAGETHTVLAAHADHFAGLGAEAAVGMRGPDQEAWLGRVMADQANLRVALATLLDTGDHDGRLRLTFDLFVPWMRTGKQVEGIDIGLAGLAAGAGDPVDRLKVWFTTALMGAEITSEAAIGHARAGLEEARATGDANLLGRLELVLGAAIRHSTTDPEFLEHLLEGRRLLELHPEPHWWEPTWERGLHDLLFGAYLGSDDDRSAEHFEAALDAFEAVGDLGMLGATLTDYAVGFIEPELSVARLRRAVGIFERIHSPYWQGHALEYLGILLRDRDADAAAAHLARAAVLLEESGDLNCWAVSSRRLALLEADEGLHLEASRRLASVIDALPRLPMQDVVVPLLLDATATVLARAGRSEEAAFVLGRATEVPLDVPTMTPRPSTHEAVRTLVTEDLGEADTAERTSAGASASNDAVFATARDWLAATT